MEEEHLLGGVASVWLKKKSPSIPGYGVYATNRRLIGTIMRRGTAVMILVGGIPGMFVGQAVTKAEGDKTIRELEEKMDFEIRKDQITQIEVTRPGIFKGGHLRVKPKSGADIDITIGGKKEYESIKELMRTFMPDATKTED